MFSVRFVLEPSLSVTGLGASQTTNTRTSLRGHSLGQPLAFEGRGGESTVGSSRVARWKLSPIFPPLPAGSPTCLKVPTLERLSILWKFLAIHSITKDAGGSVLSAPKRSSYT